MSIMFCKKTNKTQSLASSSLPRFTSAVVYQGLIMHMGIGGGNIYLDFFYSALVEFPAAIILIVTVDRIGRRFPWAVANFMTGIACLITALVPEGECCSDILGMPPFLSNPGFSNSGLPVGLSSDTHEPQPAWLVLRNEKGSSPKTAGCAQIVYCLLKFRMSVFSPNPMLFFAAFFY